MSLFKDKIAKVSVRSLGSLHEHDQDKRAEYSIVSRYTEEIVDRYLDLTNYDVSQLNDEQLSASFANSAKEDLNAYVAVWHGGKKGGISTMQRYTSSEVLIETLISKIEMAPQYHILIIVPTHEEFDAKASNDIRRRIANNVEVIRANEPLVSLEAAPSLEERNKTSMVGKPCIDLQTMLRIASICNVHPSVVTNMHKRIPFERRSTHPHLDYTKSWKPKSDESREISCFLPMCWGLGGGNIAMESQTPGFGTSAFTKLPSTSDSSVTVYLNLPDRWRESIFESWRSRLHALEKQVKPLPVDLLKLISLIIEEASAWINAQETDFANLQATTTDEQIETMREMQRQIDLLRTCKRDLICVEKTLEEVRSFFEAEFKSNYANSYSYPTAHNCIRWMKSMAVYASACQEQSNTSISKLSDSQRMIVNLAKLRNA